MVWSFFSDREEMDQSVTEFSQHRGFTFDAGRVNLALLLSTTRQRDRITRSSGCRTGLVGPPSAIQICLIELLALALRVS